VCVVCGEPLPAERVRQNALTCSADCARVHRNRRERTPREKRERREPVVRLDVSPVAVATAVAKWSAPDCSGV
jgi:hypothetical protein